MKNKFNVILYTVLILGFPFLCSADAISDSIKNQFGIDIHKYGYQESYQNPTPDPQPMQKYFESLNLVKVTEGKNIYQLAIYSETIVVATALNGQYKGDQVLLVNGQLIAETSNSLKKKGCTIHYYVDGEITTYKDRQTIKLY